MRIPLFAVAAVSVLAIGVTPAVAQDTDAAIAARLNAKIDQALAEKRIVGTVVIVARDGKVIYHRAAGLADREAGRPMRENAIFRYASVTKPFVSATFMRLVEQGRVSLSDPVTKWLPDFRPRLADGTTPTITLHQLLTHTAGLTYRFSEPRGSVYDRLNVSDGLDQPGLALDENLKRLNQAPLSYAPGTGWRYSLGIDVIGAMIEKVTGKSLPDAVRDAVTGPLRLRDAGFSVTDRSRLVTPYADGKPEPVRMTDGMYVPMGPVGVTFAPGRILNPASYPSGGAGMAGTADEVLRLL